MSEAEIAARLIEAADACAAQTAGAALASITLEYLSEAPAQTYSASVTRQTRTLVFVAAEAHAADGARVALANSVHKVRA